MWNLLISTCFKWVSCKKTRSTFLNLKNSVVPLHISNIMAHAPLSHTHCWCYKSQNSLQQLGPNQDLRAPAFCVTYSTSSFREDQVMTRKTKKTWITFRVARQWWARFPSLFSQLCILPKNWTLGTEFTHSPTLEFKNLNSSMTLSVLHSFHKPLPKWCPSSPYKLLECSACIEANTCVSYFFSLMK